LFVEVTEERRGGAPALPVPGADPRSRFPVVTIHSDSAVATSALILESLFVDRVQRRRVGRDGRPVTYITLRDTASDSSLELVELWTRENPHMPRLKVPSRGSL
jgi:hypothetical protein